MSQYDEILSAMKADFTARAGYSPDEASDLGLRMAALAAQLEEQALAIQELARQAFPETASGEYLDRHAAARGLTRKAGVPAAGSLTFTREAAAGYDILIPAGTLCQTAGEDPARFQTTQEATLAAGETAVEVPAQGVENTPDGNVPAGAVTMMVTPPPGISGVVNEAPFTGGEAPEDDAALLERYRESCRAVSNGCNAGYYRQLALEQPGVTSAAVLLGQRGTGSLDLVVYGRGIAPSGEQLEALQERVDREREIGVDALVRAAQATPVALAVEIAPRDGWDYDAVAAACREALADEMAGLGVGEPLYLARLVARLMAGGQLLNCRILSPGTDQFPIQDRVLTLAGAELTRMEVV